MILFFFERGSPCPRGKLHNWRLLQVLKNQLVFVWGEKGGGGGCLWLVPSTLTSLLRQMRGIS